MSDFKKSKLNNDKALLSASEYGDIEKIKILVQSCTNLNLKGKDNQTPLMFASKNGHL